MLMGVILFSYSVSALSNVHSTNLDLRRHEEKLRSPVPTQLGTQQPAKLTPNTKKNRLHTELSHLPPNRSKPVSPVPKHY